MNRPLTGKQLEALKLAYKAHKIAVDGMLICAYGNRFFMAGRTDPEGTAERNTLMSLVRRGLLKYGPSMTLRGEFAITDAGKKLVERLTSAS